MPKSGHMANSHAQVAAAAIVAEIQGLEVNPGPMLTNTCYSYVSATEVIHVASVHEYVAAEKTFKLVSMGRGLTSRPWSSATMAAAATLAWLLAIWPDLGISGADWVESPST